MYVIPPALRTPSPHSLARALDSAVLRQYMIPMLKGARMHLPSASSFRLDAQSLLTSRSALRLGSVPSKYGSGSLSHTTSTSLMSTWKPRPSTSSIMPICAPHPKLCMVCSMEKARTPMALAVWSTLASIAPTTIGSRPAATPNLTQFTRKSRYPSLAKVTNRGVPGSRPDSAPSSESSLSSCSGAGISGTARPVACGTSKGLGL
mmetsp:Transcript_12596/g.43739  ORF Transcript_12596/g.43739 Transcript_12596/m.43739 type:complete len:205 (-) Transcript_12596:227-841(-)